METKSSCPNRQYRHGEEKLEGALLTAIQLSLPLVTPRQIHAVRESRSKPRPHNNRIETHMDELAREVTNEFRKPHVLHHLLVSLTVLAVFAAIELLKYLLAGN